jgi:hypothetical protein
VLLLLLGIYHCHLPNQETNSFIHGSRAWHEEDYHNLNKNNSIVTAAIPFTLAFFVVIVAASVIIAPPLTALGSTAGFINPTSDIRPERPKAPAVVSGNTIST